MKTTGKQVTEVLDFIRESVGSEDDNEKLKLSRADAYKIIEFMSSTLNISEDDVILSLIQKQGK